MSELWPEGRADTVGQNGNEGLHNGLRVCPECRRVVNEGETLCSDCLPKMTKKWAASIQPEDPRETLAGLGGGPYYDPRKAVFGPKDPGAHYRYVHRAPITVHDIARGYVEVKLDPYRIADIYDLGGGPREHIVKKGLRGTSKGDSERDLIRQLRDALNRWEEMIDEDEVATCTP